MHIGSCPENYLLGKTIEDSLLNCRQENSQFHFLHLAYAPSQIDFCV